MGVDNLIKKDFTEKIYNANTKKEQNKYIKKICKNLSTHGFKKNLHLRKYYLERLCYNVPWLFVDDIFSYAIKTKNFNVVSCFLDSESDIIKNKALNFCLINGFGKKELLNSYFSNDEIDRKRELFNNQKYHDSKSENIIIYTSIILYTFNNLNDKYINCSVEKKKEYILKIKEFYDWFEFYDLYSYALSKKDYNVLEIFVEDEVLQESIVKAITKSGNIVEIISLIKLINKKHLNLIEDILIKDKDLDNLYTYVTEVKDANINKIWNVVKTTEEFEDILNFGKFVNNQNKVTKKLCAFAPINQIIDYYEKSNESNAKLIVETVCKRGTSKEIIRLALLKKLNKKYKLLLTKAISNSKDAEGIWLYSYLVKNADMSILKKGMNDTGSYQFILKMIELDNIGDLSVFKKLVYNSKNPYLIYAFYVLSKNEEDKKFYADAMYQTYDSHYILKILNLENNPDLKSAAFSIGRIGDCKDAYEFIYEYGNKYSNILIDEFQKVNNITNYELYLNPLIKLLKKPNYKQLRDIVLKTNNVDIIIEYYSNLEFENNDYIEISDNEIEYIINLLQDKKDNAREFFLEEIIKSKNIYFVTKFLMIYAQKLYDFYKDLTYDNLNYMFLLNDELYDCNYFITQAMNNIKEEKKDLFENEYYLYLTNPDIDDKFDYRTYLKNAKLYLKIIEKKYSTFEFNAPKKQKIKERKYNEWNNCCK